MTRDNRMRMIVGSIGVLIGFCGDYHEGAVGGLGVALVLFSSMVVGRGIGDHLTRRDFARDGAAAAATAVVAKE
jgi:hypothetical protein